MGKPKLNPQVKAAIKTIKERFAIGQQISKGLRSTPPHKLIADFAEQNHINRDTARKLRAMAARRTGYTASELAGWFKRFKKKGHALTISHFIRLVSVPKGKERTQLTREALKHHWSSHRLQVEILSRQRRRGKRGRKPTVITGTAFKGELDRAMWAWDRWLELHLVANRRMRAEIARELRAIQRKIAKVKGLLAKRSRGK
jgi:hypothetical protein